MVDEALKKVFDSIDNRTPEEQTQMDVEFKEKEQMDNLAQVIHDARDHLVQRQEDHASEKIVNYLLNNYIIYSIKNDKVSEIYYYEDGEIKPNGESFLKEKIRRILLHAFTPQRANKVISKICADRGIDIEELHQSESDNIYEIPARNGILNIKTKELSEFSPDKIFFNKINAIYDPDADCPNIKFFLSEIVKNKEDINVIFEMIGSTLYKKYFIQTIVMFLGDGENGKGVLQNLIRSFLSAKNCKSLPLNQLTSESFEVADLRGALANIAGDISNTDLKDTGRIKELSSGTDQITAKRKFMSALYFVNYAKLIFSCNELPRVYDFSHGFWRRWLLLEFPFLFLRDNEYKLRKNESNVKKANPEIIDKLTTEAEFSGLLNEALKGLSRLMKNKQFSNTKSTEEIKNLWIRKSDSFTAFCFDFLEGDTESFITKKELAKSFNKFCKEHRLRGASSQSMKRTLQELFGCLEDKKYIETQQERVWEGIKFKNKSKKTEILPYIQNKNSHIESNNMSFLTNPKTKKQKAIFSDEEIRKNTDWTDEEIENFHKEGIL